MAAEPAADSTATTDISASPSHDETHPSESSAAPTDDAAAPGATTTDAFRLELRPVLDVELSRSFAFGVYTPFTLLRGNEVGTGAESALCAIEFDATGRLKLSHVTHEIGTGATTSQAVR